jgi:hypothetical protein
MNFPRRRFLKLAVALDAYQRAEIARWWPIIKAAGIEAK